MAAASEALITADMDGQVLQHRWGDQIIPQKAPDPQDQPDLLHREKIVHQIVGNPNLHQRHPIVMKNLHEEDSKGKKLYSCLTALQKVQIIIVH